MSLILPEDGPGIDISTILEIAIHFAYIIFFFFLPRSPNHYENSNNVTEIP